MYEKGGFFFFNKGFDVIAVTAGWGVVTACSSQIGVTDIIQNVLTPLPRYGVL